MGVCWAGEGSRDCLAAAQLHSRHAKHEPLLPPTLLAHKLPSATCKARLTAPSNHPCLAPLTGQRALEEHRHVAIMAAWTRRSRGRG